jgi:alpha-beta hydrolase superfamily lysophospholipase
VKGQADTYDEAVQRLETARAADPSEVLPRRATQLLTHGRKTERVIVLLQGLTNSPRQFMALGQRFFDLDYNVLIPRMPHHGYADRLTDILGKLTVADLKTWAEDAVDVAHGLGDQLTVAGISAGGVTASWIAQTRADVYLAAPIAPALAFRGLNATGARIAGQLMLTLPNRMMWWDPRIREALEPEHVYPRFATRALGAGLRLGAEVMALARNKRPAAQHIKMIVSKHDPTLNNRVARQLVTHWQAHRADATYHDPDFGPIHDIIDPAQSYQRVDEVYPVLIDLLTK